jgi:hypothetical protein
MANVTEGEAERKGGATCKGYSKQLLRGVKGQRGQVRVVNAEEIGLVNGAESDVAHLVGVASL